LHAVIGLTEQIKAASDAAEAERRLPSSVAAAIQEAGVFGMVMPRAWSGPELDPLMQIRVIEALAMADGSAGWCAMIGCDSGYVSAFLDQSVARARPARGHRRRRHDDGRGAASARRVSGERAVPVSQRLSSFRMGLAQLHRRRGRGAARRRQWSAANAAVLLHLSECEILDTWFTTGLRGTGINRSMRSRTCSSRRTRRRRLASPAGQSTRRSSPPPENRRDATRSASGWSPAKVLREASTFRRRSVGQRRSSPRRALTCLTWSAISGRALSMVDNRPTEMALFTTLYPHAVGACVEVVQLIYKAAGGTAVYQRGPLDRRLRDILTMNQHVVGTMRTYEMAGRLLLGLEQLRWLF
jgi:hypothetical protein